MKPWRRKVGLLTLAMACAVSGAWVKSHVTPVNTEFVVDGDTFIRVVSLAGNIDCERFHQDGTPRLSRIQFLTAKGVAEKDKNRLVEWKWNSMGFGRGEYRSELLDELQIANPCLPFGSISQFVWRIPYWSIVVPLIVFSAVLLLAKPHKSTLEDRTKPVLAEGA